MSNINSAIRKFNRFELKYLLPIKAANSFKRELGAYLEPDRYGDGGSYGVSNLYYDSPNLRCYREKADGLRFRRKLRIRRYETGQVFTDETPVFLEIKQRVDRVTQKRRAVLPYSEALRLCNDRQIPDHVPDDKAVVEEIFAFLWQYNLRPASIVRYDRQAFIGTDYDIGLRVTFDTSLSFQSYPLRLHEQSSSLPMLSANLVVMEIKVNERIPYWLTEMIAAHDLQMVRVSKYCRSIEAAQDMPSTRWRHLAAERSQDVLSSSVSLFSTWAESWNRRAVENEKTEVSRGYF